MANGKKLSVNQAKPIIRKFIADEIQRTGLPENDIVVGHKFDLQLLRDFLTGIDNDPKKNDIKAFRVYFAKSKRSSVEPEQYDVVIVPVLSNDEDLHRVYRLVGDDDPQDTILGNSLPCPNVCPNGFFCD